MWRPNTGARGWPGLCCAMRKIRHVNSATPGWVLSTAEVQKAAIALYYAEGFTFVRREEAQARSHKTVGGGIVRLHFEKALAAAE